MILSFVAFGKSEPAGSKRGFARPLPGGKFRVSVIDANAKAGDWKNSVRAAAAEAMGRCPLFRGPLVVAMRFYAPRPKSHYRTGKNSHLLRDGAPWAPTSKPDALKLARAVEDAMTGTVYVDDSQTTDLSIAKRYGEPARVEVEVVSEDFD